MNLSLLELQHIIESGFLPVKCRCTGDHSGELTIELLDPRTGNNLVKGGIPISGLQTSRDIANLVGKLRAEMAVSSHQAKRTRA